MSTSAETYLILKYGSITAAYVAWIGMSYKEEAVLTTDQRQVLMDFEFEKITRSVRIR